MINADNNLVLSKENQSIVKYDRRFCEFRQINLLSKVDQDLFFSTLSIIRERKKTTVTITGKELIERSGYLKKRLVQYSAKNMIKLINQMTDRVNSCYIYWHDEETNEDHKLFLFQEFKINRDTADFTASLTPAFAHYFFDIKHFPFTRFALPGFIALKSKYSKVLYRLFLDNYAGVEISTDELFNLLGTKTSSAQRQFIYKLPIYLNEIQQVTRDFKGPITYQVNKEHERGRGSKYISVVFDYEERENRVIEGNGKNQELPPCPYCGQKLTYRVNKSTGKKFIGHQDIEHLSCRVKSFNDLNDLIAQIAKEEERKENIQKAKEAAKTDPVYLASIESNAKSDLPDDFDPEVVVFPK